MRKSGIKAYFELHHAVDGDPKAIAIYEESIAELIPAITKELRESELRAADFRLTRSVVAKDGANAAPAAQPLASERKKAGAEKR